MRHAPSAPITTAFSDAWPTPTIITPWQRFATALGASGIVLCVLLLGCIFITLGWHFNPRLPHGSQLFHALCKVDQRHLLADSVFVKNGKWLLEVRTHQRTHVNIMLWHVRIRTSLGNRISNANFSLWIAISDRQYWKSKKMHTAHTCLICRIQFEVLKKHVASQANTIV